MLAYFRKSANSFVIKVLMILLLATFVLWGVGDMIRHRGGAYVVQIGNFGVTPADFSRLIRQEINMIETQMNYTMTKEDLNDPQTRQMLAHVVINKLILQYMAADLGIKVSDDMVKYEVATMPIFQKNGKFDKEQFDLFLKNSGLGEARFIELVKEQISSRIMNSMFQVARYDSKLLEDTILSARGQERTVEVLNLKPDMVSDIANPSEEDLKGYYNENADVFSIPEKRSFKIAVLSADSVKDVTISESDLQEYYNSHKASFNSPAVRKVYQMVFSSDEEAQAALLEIKKPTDFMAVAKKHFPQNESFLLGDITQEGLNKDVADAIFNIPAPGVSKVVPSPLGYHVFMVESEKKGVTKSFAEIKDELRKNLARDAKLDALQELLKNVDKEILGGKSLSQVAAQYNLKLELVEAVSRGSNKGHMKNDTVAAAVFATDLNQTSPVTPFVANDTFFVLEVVKVEPKSAIPFEQVRSDVTKLWTLSSKVQKMEDISTKISNDLAQGKSFEEIVAAYKLAQPERKTVSIYSEAGKTLSFEMMREIMATKPGQQSKLFKNQDGYAAIKVVSVKDANMSSVEARRANVKAELAQNYSHELMNQVVEHASEKYSVKIDNKFIESMDF